MQEPDENPQHPVTLRFHEERTFGERLADRAATEIGSWRFLIVQTLAVSAWVLLNLLAFFGRWDPYPFILLNLLFSVQAAYTGPVLLLSQNRQAERDRAMAEHDYVTNQRAEQLIEGVMSEVLRNSRTTVAIARHLCIDLDDLESYARKLEEEMETVEVQLGEVEDALNQEETRDQVPVQS
ncbi:MAG TPA: DUF1003 domain-containing protein [Chloroflexota bacterium]|nr:DUF1003 domain-containing protein [Chloroflexota bacterium]